ncbi:MAG: extracellular solute-binding protein [Planctomycetales bacterium]|nr:extracellular solute-binding protein [Planctomycetales bacterium]
MRNKYQKKSKHTWSWASFSGLWAVWLGLLLVSPGCDWGGSDSSEKPPQPNRPLRIAVVEDEVLAERIQREWMAQNAEPISLQNVSRNSLDGAQRMSADVILFSTVDLGQLIAGQQLRPLPFAANDDNSAAEPNSAVDLDDVLPLNRRLEMRWGEQTYAVTLGSPVLVLMYRKDWFEKLGLEPPTTWTQYQDVVQKLANRPEFAPQQADEAWFAVAEPWKAGWASRMFLQRAAAYVSSPNQYSNVFDVTTMKALIDTEPFVQALTEMQAAANLLPADAKRLDPHEAAEIFWSGNTPLALTWPSAARTADSLLAEMNVGFAACPGSDQFYLFSSGQWQDRAHVVSVPLLGTSGRMAGMSAGARDLPSVMNFLAWLTSAQQDLRIAQQSPATTMYRFSHLVRPQAWVETAAKPAAEQYAQVLRNNHAATAHQVLLRIPGANQYLAVLDQHVDAVLSGAQEPAAALAEVAAEWDRITDQLGRANQKDAFAKSLGLNL